MISLEGGRVEVGASKRRVGGGREGNHRSNLYVRKERTWDDISTLPEV